MTDAEDTPDVETLVKRLDEMEARMDALNRSRLYLSERVDDLDAENEQLRARLSELSDIVDLDPEATDYASLSRDQKVHRIRRVLVEDATRSATGKAAMTYGEIQALFGKKPSPGHAYDLMDDAGELDGFDYQTPSDREYRIVVDLGDVKDASLVHAANNALQEVGGR